jgi:hypothetical protein
MKNIVFFVLSVLSFIGVIFADTMRQDHVVLHGTYFYLFDFGPPGFGENKKVDKLERVDYLLLDKPLDSNGLFVKAVQIQWDAVPDDLCLGDSITLSGQLFESTLPSQRFRKTLEFESIVKNTNLRGMPNGSRP